MLEGARSLQDMGRHFGAGLYERELAWFMEKEWVRSADDVLWRRTKAGLHLDDGARAEVAVWLDRATR